MRTVRIALILSGGTSLGAFQAGVLTELLYALDWHAKHPQSGRRYELDVLTGGSAGAMTAALVARTLMHGYDAWKHQLHDAWVEMIDIEDLMRDPPAASLFSPVVVERIARLMLGTPPAGGEPAPFAPAVLRMMFSVANLTGLPASMQDPATGERFTSTFYKDRRRFVLQHTLHPDGRVHVSNIHDAELWRRIREAAIASGRFPIAFPLAPLGMWTLPDGKPDDSEYGWVDRALLPGGELPKQFWCVDGGLFNNEPIGDAVDLARDADGGALDPERIFILSDANLNTSAFSDRLNAETALRDTVGRLLGAVLGEAGANDWLRAQRVNAEVAWRDRVLERLGAIIGELQLPGVARDQLQVSLEAAAKDVVEHKRAMLGEGRYPRAGFEDRARPHLRDRYLQDALIRTEAVLGARAASLDPEARELHVLMTFLVNSAAGLDKKASLNLHMIATTHEESAGGDDFGNFTGFLDRRWREFDFRQGRIKARGRLPGILGPYDAEPPVNGNDPYAQAGDFRNVSIRDASRDTRERLQRLLAAMAGRQAEALGGRSRVGRWIVRHVAGALVQRQLTGFLGLDRDEPW